MNDSLKLKDRAMAILTRIYRDTDEDGRIMAVLIGSLLSIFVNGFMLLTTKVTPGNYVTTSLAVGFCLAWVTFFAMTLVAFVYDIQDRRNNKMPDVKANFVAGVFSGAGIMLWYYFIAIVILAPLHWILTALFA